jgi:hypothetical protein
MEIAHNDLPLEVERKLEMENELTVLEKRLETDTNIEFAILYSKRDIENDIKWLKSELGIESGKKLDFDA